LHPEKPKRLPNFHQVFHQKEEEDTMGLFDKKEDKPEDHSTIETLKTKVAHLKDDIKNKFSTNLPSDRECEKACKNVQNLVSIRPPEVKSGPIKVDEGNLEILSKIFFQRWDKGVARPLSDLTFNTCMDKCSHDYAITKRQASCLADANDLTQMTTCFQKELMRETARKLQDEIERLQEKIKEYEA